MSGKKGESPRSKAETRLRVATMRFGRPVEEGGRRCEGDVNGKMNESFEEKDEKYRDWATRATREKKVSKAVMVPLVISHDGAIHKDTVRRWNDIARDIRVDWVRMTQNVLRYNV